jgi:hypothetical protein
LYRLVQQHAATFFAQTEDAAGADLPLVVKDECEAFLECGILAHGFSLHASVRCGADDRQALEQLCRYIRRPALANERVQTNAARQVELRLKTPWRDGTTPVVMTPLVFMQRLAALVTRPRSHLIRFHGVLGKLEEQLKS